MELYQSIREAVNKQGLSIRPAAKEFKVHRREVRRALVFGVPQEHNPYEMPIPTPPVRPG